MGRPREHDERTREQLLAAAERLVSEGGPDALSVRGVAEEAGATTRAIYSIFGSKEGLIAALAQVAYDWLYNGVDRVPETDDPAADLVAIGLEVFRRFVRDHPALYRIAYQRVVGLQPHPDLVATRERTFVQLQERVRRLKDAGLLDQKPVVEATVELIAMFEGLANAELRGRVLPTIPAGGEDHAWREGLATLLRGLTATPVQEARHGDVAQAADSRDPLRPYN
jgi:AcrR family transcriptional regulator